MVFHHLSNIDHIIPIKVLCRTRASGWRGSGSTLKFASYRFDQSTANQRAYGGNEQTEADRIGQDTGCDQDQPRNQNQQTLEKSPGRHPSLA